MYAHYLLVDLHIGGPVDGGGDEGGHVDEDTENELLERGEEGGAQSKVFVNRSLVI